MHVNIHFCVMVNPYVKETKVVYMKIITWNVPKSEMLRTKERYFNCIVIHILYSIFLLMWN